MDTKWKKSIYSPWVKAAAFVLMVMSAVFAVLTLSDVAKNTERWEPAVSGSYLESRTFQDEMSAAQYTVVDLLKYKSEDYIREGNLITERRLRDYSTAYNRLRYYQSEEYHDGDEKREMESLTKSVEEEKARMIRKDLNQFYSLQNALARENGLCYYVTDGTHTFTNMPEGAEPEEFFRTLPVMESYRNGRIDSSGQSNSMPHYEDRISSSREEAFVLNPETDTVYVGFNDAFISPKQMQWEADRQFLSSRLAFLIGCLTATALFGVFLLVTAGRRPDGTKGNLCTIDWFYTDVLAVAIICVMCVGVASIDGVMIDGPVWLKAFVAAAASTVAFGAGLSLVRQAKAKRLFRHSMVGAVILWVVHGIQAILRQQRMTRRVLVLVIGYSVIVALCGIFLFPVAIALIVLAVWYLMKRGRDYEKLLDGAKRIRGGALDYQFDIPGDSLFRPLADDMEAISEGLSNAIASELKSERYRTELITNVSHDIRTPLTSILTYVDLLKKEGLTSENAPKYLSVLDQKAARLKTLTDDLFEAAKAQSGNVDAELTSVDVCALLKQGMGELDDKIKKSGLHFKIDMPDSLLVTADGKLLWRVMENLIGNALKYALHGSRVYIDISRENDACIFVMKNISAYELNIPAEELLMRFKRGDASRNTEGSGLGLSIAESLMTAQRGTFAIDIDGDLFKVTLTLPAAEPGKQ